MGPDKGEYSRTGGQPGLARGPGQASTLGLGGWGPCSIGHQGAPWCWLKAAKEFASSLCPLLGLASSGLFLAQPGPRAAPSTP